VATYAARACEKLRGQGSLCKKIRVSILTSMFNPDEPKFARGMICELPYPADDSRIITKAAMAGLVELFRDCFKFSKAEVLLVDLRQRGEFTDDMFAQVQPETSERVVGVMDKINAKWGRGTRPGGVPATPAWSIRRELKRPSFTTRLDEL
jgi:DNA polymerase V